MAKTLLDFRAEKGLYLKDVAETTGIPEDELRAVEESGTVPPEIAEILINDYHLPDAYFSEIVVLSDAQPKSPMKYFFGTSFVCLILSSLMSGIPLFVGMMITFIVTFSRGTLDFSVTDSPIFTIFNSVWTTAVSLITCIMFANFILKNTQYKGDIKKYQYLHYAIPSGAFAAFSIASAYFTEFALHLKTEENLTAALGVEIIGLFVSLTSTLVSVYVSALLLKTAIEEDNEKKFKTLKALAIVVTVSSVIAYILTIISYMFSENAHFLVLIRRFFVYALYIAVAWAVALVNPDDEKKNKIAFTILPLISICQGFVFTVIGLFV